MGVWESAVNESHFGSVCPDVVNNWCRWAVRLVSHKLGNVFTEFLLGWVFLLCFFFLILFFINASLDNPSPKYLYLYIDLNSLKGVNIFLMSLGNFFLLFLFLFFWRFEGF